MLSVIVPVYNEKATIEEIVKRIQAVPLEKEIILVDDASSDGTSEIIQKLAFSNPEILSIHHQKNQGKGQSILDALKEARGEIAIIQDADLEYDPKEYVKLLAPLNNNEADLAFGARFFIQRSGLPFHRLGNQVLTGLLNFLFRTNLNDYATCYKMGSLKTFRSLNLKATGFDIDVEITCNAIKKGLKIKEIPISYFPRNFKEGKKIRLVDGLWAIFYIIKYRLSKI